MREVLRFHLGMLELISVSHVFTRPAQAALTALDHVSFSVPAGHLLAVIGAGGSGKSTLLHLLTGLHSLGGGKVLFRGREVSPAALPANEIGYVPASDDVLNTVLTVKESILGALALRVGGLTKESANERVEHLLLGVGLETVANLRAGALPLVQKRRLKLALALVADPSLVLCDEFTEGLDAKSQGEMVALLKFIASDHPSRVVLHSSQTVANLAVHDTVVVLHEGHVCFHGPARAVNHYFSIESIEELYPRLAKRPASRWGESWSRHRDSYYNAFKLGGVGESLSTPGEDESETTVLSTDETPVTAPISEPLRDDHAVPSVIALPTLTTQVKHLIQRRWVTLCRNQWEWTAQLSLTVLAPIATVMLMLPNDHFLSKVTSGDTSPEVLWPAAYTCAMGWLLQVLWVLVFSVRGSSREIAGEWGLYMREKIGGLHPLAYLLGKLGYILPLVILQSFLLAGVVEILTGGLPGFVVSRFLLLGATGVAFSSLCLATSALSESAERAHSRAWMLAFTNLFLCGALLGFPRVLGGVLHPFITAYYGWSAGMDTLVGTPFFEPLTQFVRTWFAAPSVAFIVLFIHFCLGVLLTLQGLKKGVAREVKK